RRPAEFRKRFFGKRFVLNESLPRPFSELRRFHVGRRIKKDDRAAIRKPLDKRSHENELCFGKVVDRVQDEALESLQPSNCPFADARGGERAAVLWIVEADLT